VNTTKAILIIVSLVSLLSSAWSIDTVYRLHKCRRELSRAKEQVSSWSELAELREQENHELAKQLEASP
jgi:hypothetical protein